VIERPSDDIEVPMVLKSAVCSNEINSWSLLLAPETVPVHQRKQAGRAALLAVQPESPRTALRASVPRAAAAGHFAARWPFRTRRTLFSHSKGLSWTDLHYVLKKSSYLLQELIHVYSQLYMYATSGRSEECDCQDKLKRGASCSHENAGPGNPGQHNEGEPDAGAGVVGVEEPAAAAAARHRGGAAAVGAEEGRRARLGPPAGLDWLVRRSAT